MQAVTFAFTRCSKEQWFTQGMEHIDIMTTNTVLSNIVQRVLQRVYASHQSRFAIHDRHVKRHDAIQSYRLRPSSC